MTKKEKGKQKVNENDIKMERINIIKKNIKLKISNIKNKNNKL